MSRGLCSHGSSTCTISCACSLPDAAFPEPGFKLHSSFKHRSSLNQANRKENQHSVFTTPLELNYKNKLKKPNQRKHISDKWTVNKEMRHAGAGDKEREIWKGSHPWERPEGAHRTNTGLQVLLPAVQLQLGRARLFLAVEKGIRQQEGTHGATTANPCW